jgi:hypothetical protein
MFIGRVAGKLAPRHWTAVLLKESGLTAFLPKVSQKANFWRNPRSCAHVDRAASGRCLAPWFTLTENGGRWFSHRVDELTIEKTATPPALLQQVIVWSTNFIIRGAFVGNSLIQRSVSSRFRCIAVTEQLQNASLHRTHMAQLQDRMSWHASKQS